MTKLHRFEHRDEALIPREHFVLRMLSFAAGSFVLIALSLALGASGYHWIAGLRWIDSLVNAAMILTGMGPVDRMETDGAKLFSAGYALFSGIAFLTIVAVLFAPAVHRFLHALHLETGDAQKRRRS
jgi:hypothetical protein